MYMESLKAETLLAQNVKKWSTNIEMGQIFIHLEMLKIIVYNTFQNLYKLIAVIYVILISNETCKRAFTAMQRTKSRLHSIIAQVQI